VHDKTKNDTVTGASGSIETDFKDGSFKKRETVQFKGTSLAYDANYLSFWFARRKISLKTISTLQT